MDDCVFCKIIQGAIPARKVYEDEQVYAFHDISPQAPVHVLVMPKKHILDLSEAAQYDGICEACLQACTAVAKLMKIDQTGYRVAANTGPHACQSVPHLHFHVLGGDLLSARVG
ncbi:MAG: histidine triad nucleotide-binding protein [Clostridia bacterium]|nr:histidine triad nucleotide-binding protein [Clostridia bacterium]